ncbi:MAG: hypothetical protein ACF8R7_09700 [Phycisphaerales bacterium JB039]
MSGTAQSTDWRRRARVACTLAAIAMAGLLLVCVPFAFAVGRIDAGGAPADFAWLERGSLAIFRDREVAAAGSLTWDVMIKPSGRLRLDWRPGVSASRSRFHLYLPLWIPAAVFGISALALRKRREPFACRKCGYDLSGHAGPCPECGDSQETGAG